MPVTELMEEEYTSVVNCEVAGLSRHVRESDDDGQMNRGRADRETIGLRLNREVTPHQVMVQTPKQMKILGEDVNLSVCEKNKS